MKKQFVFMLTLLSLTACNFLEREPYDKIDPTMEVTDNVAVAMANACYRTLQSSNMYNQRLWTLDIVAGNSNVGAGGGTDGLETVQAANFTTLADNGMALYMWRSPWVGIGQCNILIQAMEEADGIEETTRLQCLGEALFLRAHYYYILVRLYGGVPLRLTPYEPGTSTAIARNTAEEVYQQIIADIKRAYELLPEKQEYPATELGRATKDACCAMLADLYLTIAPKGWLSTRPDEGYYERVIDLCSEIADMGYDLYSCNYEDNFNALIHNGAESIFEVQFSGNTEYDFWGNNPQSSWLSAFMGPRNADFVAGGYGWNQPTEEFVSQYEEGDLRKDITIFYEGCPNWDPQGVNKSYRSGYSNTGYNVRKFCVTKEISPEYNTSPANFVVYRYADVLLMKAEALNELGRTAEACAPLNIVRYRAGLNGVSGLSQDEMREKIIHERRIELAFEGHRWFDMIRINNGDYAVNFLHSIGKTNATKERLLFPIPQTERDANPLIDQNPGY